MLDSMWRRTTATASAATVLVLGGLWLGATPADAAAPDPGTGACTALVEADATVEATLGALTGLPATAPLTERQGLQARLDELRVAAALRLCTGADDPTTSPTAPPVTTDPTTPPTTPDDDGPAAPAPSDVRDCSDFATRADAQAFFDRVATPEDRDPSGLDSDGDGVACEPVASSGGSGDVGTGTIDLDPTDDDDSVADTDGSQVVEVPEGSASTGGGV